MQLQDIANAIVSDRDELLFKQEGRHRSMRIARARVAYIIIN